MVRHDQRPVARTENVDLHPVHAQLDGSQKRLEGVLQMPLDDPLAQATVTQDHRTGSEHRGLAHTTPTRLPLARSFPRPRRLR
jgi:hypothetical protein